MQCAAAQMIPDHNMRSLYCVFISCFSLFMGTQRQQLAKRHRQPSVAFNFLDADFNADTVRDTRPPSLAHHDRSTDHQTLIIFLESLTGSTEVGEVYSDYMHNKTRLQVVGV
jgi:hypothetical protein